MDAASIVVTAGIIRKDCKYLLAQRKDGSWLEPNKWEFPGGKLRYLEDPEDCLAREVKEELNIEIKIDGVFEINSHIYEKEGKKTHILLIAYLADWVKGELQHLDVQDSRWIDIADIYKFELAAADVPIARKLLEKYGCEERG